MSKRVAKQISQLQHVRSKSMWVGDGKNKKRIVSAYDDEKQAFILQELKFPDSLYKIIDEVIVNALDHASHYPTLVTKIVISHDEGVISVWNNGPGIPQDVVVTVSGKSMSAVQLIASEFLAGDNLDDAGENTKGGTNGLGLKLACAFSKEMFVETCDGTHKYRQRFHAGETDILADDPVVTKCTKSYTCVTFTPNYTSDFGLKLPDFLSTLDILLKTRAYQAAAWSTARVYYNEERISVTFHDYTKLFTDVAVTFKLEHSKYPWDVSVGLSSGVAESHSIINGVVVADGGTHVKYITDLIVDGLKPLIERDIKKSGAKFNKNFVTCNLAIWIKGVIPSPTFSAQIKNAIADDPSKYSYAFTNQQIRSIYELCKDKILSMFLKKTLGVEKTRVVRGKIEAAKYEEAYNCRFPSKCLDCGLIITEGDSAMGTADIGLKDTSTGNFNYEWFGAFSIGGVPMNGLKESFDTKEGRRIPNAKLQANVRISALVKVLGLDYNKTYETEREWKTLRYGFIVGLTDQDLDGFNIFGLVVTFILTYWPALLSRGFIRRIVTPVIRAYPTKKGYVKEFYSEKEANAWMEEVGTDVANYHIRYYKGLGSHLETHGEVTQMFKNINDKIKTYTLDDEALTNMNIYYGKDTAVRKVVLASSTIPCASTSLEVPMSEQFTIDSKLYQRDNIVRKLLSVVDGFVSSRRKVFYAARLNGNKEIKVQGLAGKTVECANYHHGEESLEQTIIRMAQGFPCARNMPLLLPLGMFGSRPKGYKDSAASRYIYTRINANLANKLFRREDEFVLEYEVDDGVRYEPKYYVPVIPYVLCEDNQLPATGWVIDIHARHIDDIIENCRRFIRDSKFKCKKMRPWCKDFKGDIVKHKGKSYYVGVYEYDEETNTVHITELPIGVYSKYLIYGIRGDTSDKKEEIHGLKIKEHIEDIIDDTNKDGVSIKVILKEGAYEAISRDYGNETFDCFIEYLDLKVAINHHINLVNEHREVVEYNTYEEVFMDWARFRKELYGKRVRRELITIVLEIEMLQSMQRFSSEHTDYHITRNTTESEMYEILSSKRYTVYNHTLINNPRYTEVSELYAQCTEVAHGASYDYLTRMSYKDLTTEAFEARKKCISNLRARHEYLSDDTELFTGAKIWEIELNELEVAIKEGIASEWFYGTNKFKFH